MGAGTVQAIIALTQLLSVINEMTATADKIAQTIEKARSEDRDLTDAELSEIAAETNAKHDQVKALLARASRA